MWHHYFLLYLSYDGTGHATLANEVVSRRRPLAGTSDVRRLEKDLSQGLARGAYVILLHFIPLGTEPMRRT